jgi:hypothetical protein
MHRHRDPTKTGILGAAVSLEERVAQAAAQPAVRKSELRAGDVALVTTRNSVYAIRALGDGTYQVTGGWFDRQGASPSTVGVNGCTWGGSAIREDVVAAPGLFLEFSNHVRTTRIRLVEILRREQLGSANVH